MRKPVEGARYSLGLKVTGATKKRIDNEARRTGRTQSQEVETRIEWTFRQQDLLPGVLELAYGRQLANLVQQVASAGQNAELQALREKGLPPVWDDPWFLEDAVGEMKRALDGILDKAKNPAMPAPGTTTHNILGGNK